MRDWTSTLWPASFNGIPFFVEMDREEGGRRLSVHQFPGSDVPFVEDMGKDFVSFKITAYLASDTSDIDSSVLVAALVSLPVPGILVLPVQGAQTARLERYCRNFSKDRMGYIALDLSFIQDGAPFPLASALYLSQMVFDAVGALGTAASSFASNIQIMGQPNWITGAAINQLQDVPATLETINAAAVIDPAISYSIQTTLSGIFNAIPAAVSPLTGLDTSVVSDAFTAAATLATSMVASDAVEAFGAALDAVVQPQASSLTTPGALAMNANSAMAARLSRLALMSGYVTALMGMSFANQPAGIAARAALVARFDVELALCIGAPNVDLNIALQNLRAQVMAWFVAIITDLRPVITVTSQMPLPSLWWAWRLYQDPTQAPALVAANNVPHPAWMPMRFQTTAPAA